MDGKVADRVAERVRVHAALADPMRLGIVDELTVSDRSPLELRRMLGVESNLLAHHLQVLEDAGLVARSVSHGDRRRRYVRLTPGPLATLLEPRLLLAAGVVFVCTANSARSQLAAALWNEASSVPASSAGTDPAERVHPQTVRAARRHGLDLARAAPRRFEPGDGRDLLVVTVCDVAHEQLAEWSSADGRRPLHWSVADPASSGDAGTFDATVAELAARVDLLSPVVVAS
jgi:ArsR family transcriptional regulator, arsenate/arsenite/antimonite-responsive transcriptional repressor / arsenate reductase (thioredoxin)